MEREVRLCLMGGPDLTELQQAILHTKHNNPDLTHKQIARTVNCSKSYIDEILSEHDIWEIEAMSEDPVTADEIDRDYPQPDSWDFEDIVAYVIILIIATKIVGLW